MGIGRWMFVGVFALAGCQSLPPEPDAIRAACVSQSYLRTNGFLSAPPEKRLDLSLTVADTHTYELNDGSLDYARMIKDRHNRFTGKLLGVRLPGEDTKFLVVYRGKGRERQCVGVVSSFAFAFFAPAPCKAAPLVPLRERALTCGD